MSTMTPDDLAEELKIERADVLRFRRELGWPSLKIGNKIRFLPEHVAAIKESLEVRPAVEPEPEVPVIAGQTDRSARARRTS